MKLANLLTLRIPRHPDGLMDGIEWYANHLSELTDDIRSKTITVSPEEAPPDAKDIHRDVPGSQR